LASTYKLIPIFDTGFSQIVFDRVNVELSKDLVNYELDHRVFDGW